MTATELLDATNCAVTPEDELAFKRLIFARLTQEQVEGITNPTDVYSDVKDVLAIHWHPEFIPLELVTERLHALFPNMESSLVIPTQHNCLMEYEGYLGTEVDCFSEAFNQKVQLLIHFAADKYAKTTKFREMLDHTYEYRATQLFDLITTIVKPISKRINSASIETGAEREVMDFVRAQVTKVKTMVDNVGYGVPPDMLKNKLLRDFLDTRRSRYGDGLVNRGQAFLKAVKEIVKEQFPPQHFYRTEEVIEEARAVGCGIVVPHPEQFWPILLANYDIDGFEVWNPQSRKYTDFLISVVMDRNSHIPDVNRKLLLFMGDDTHFGEKVKPKHLQDPLKTGREIGFQPAWDDVAIKARLEQSGMNKRHVIERYRERISS